MQPSLFDTPTAKELGIQKAADHAEAVCEGWQEMAYNFLHGYARTRKEFMIEEVRNASAGIVPKPTTGMAWGAVVLKAKKEKIIEWSGYRAVTNDKAHGTPASVWKSKIFI